MMSLLPQMPASAGMASRAVAAGPRAVPQRARMVVPRAAQQSHQIFAVNQATGDVTLEDVRNARACCDCLTGRNRADCFASYGIDATTVDKYYETVFSLEANLDEATAPWEAPLQAFQSYVVGVLRATGTLIGAVLGLAMCVVLPVLVALARGARQTLVQTLVRKEARAPQRHIQKH